VNTSLIDFDNYTITLTFDDPKTAPTMAINSNKDHLAGVKR